MTSSPTEAKTALPLPAIAADSREQVAVMVTRRCNMSCAHCSVASSPSISNEPSDDELIRIVDEILDARVRNIQFTGGEPMLREPLLLRLMETAQARGVSSSMTSNGYWGKDPVEAEEKLKALRKAGLILLTISYDPFHEAFLPIEAVQNIGRAAEKQQFTVQVNISRLRNDQDLDQIVGPLEELDCVELRFYDVQPVGRAKQFADEEIRSNLEGFCNACERAAISDDGRVMACNGPAYFTKDDSPLIIGSLDNHTVGELLDLHAADPILQTIRTKGPLYLKETLEKLPEGSRFPFREEYHGLCDLCLHINSDARACEALRERLSEPREVAQRESLRLLIQKQRIAGEFNRTFVNRAGITRILLDASIPGLLPDSTGRRSQLLSRPDLDWQQVLRTITGNGLARPLTRFFESPDVSALTPAFVQDSIRNASVAESVKLLEVQKTLRLIATCLEEAGAEAVLLKGAALVVQSLSDGEAIPCKTPGDIDLYIDPDKANAIQEKLLENGFEGLVADAASHHLPLLRKGTILVEIHVRILPEFWGLPEEAMLKKLITVSGWEPFRVLSTEGFLLHTAVHTTSEGYTHGLKTFWGQLFTMKLAGPDSIDWNLLRKWAASCRCPRSFWIPIQLAAYELSFPIPEDFLEDAPRGRRQDKLLGYASNRIYSTMSHSEAGFILQKFPHDLLLCDSPGGAMRLLWAEFSPRGIARRFQYIREIGWGAYFRSKRDLAISYFRHLPRLLTRKRR